MPGTVLSGKAEGVARLMHVTCTLLVCGFMSSG